MTEKIQVRVKAGCQHRQEHESYDPKQPTGNPGPLALAGEVITVSQAEMDAHGDKFTLLDPVLAVLSKQNGAAPVQNGPTVEQLQAELISAQAAKAKAEKSAQRARATLKSTRTEHAKELDKLQASAAQSLAELQASVPAVEA